MSGPRYDVRIARGHAWCLFDLRGSAERILGALGACGLPQPEQANRRAVGESGATVARIGPGRWFVHAPAAQEGRLAAMLAHAIDRLPDADMALVSDQFEAFRLQGRGAADILAQGTALDIAPASLAADALTATDMFGAGVLLERSDEPGDGFILLIERSFGDWLERWLHAATGRPCAIEPGNRVTDGKRQRSL
jgi:heterotetrameric sarcosine oxidase gamma subunit